MHTHPPALSYLSLRPDYPNLSYLSVGVGGNRGSNPQLMDCKVNALPTELPGHKARIDVIFGNKMVLLLKKNAIMPSDKRED